MGEVGEVLPDEGHDRGLTHLALAVRDLDESLAFWTGVAGLHLVHRRTDHDGDVAWVGDLARPFVLVLLEAARVEPLQPWSHVGLAVGSRAEVDAVAAAAQADGSLVEGPADHGEPVGYLAMLRDPDGHTLEVSYGQDVARAVVEAVAAARAAAKAVVPPPA